MASDMMRPMDETHQINLMIRIQHDGEPINWREFLEDAVEEYLAESANTLVELEVEETD